MTHTSYEQNLCRRGAQEGMPASSPLRNAAPRPGAARSPSAALRGVVNSPASGASSVARRAERPEPPSTLKCGRYPNGIGNFPCENKVYLNGVDFQAFRQDDDAPVHLQVCTVDGKPAQCVEFAGQRP